MVKTYADFMNELSPDELYKGLLAHGLFAEKLPPIFTSENFFNYCEGMGQAFERKDYKYVYYENMRNINIPRPLGIPVPMGYQRLCACLRDNWAALQAHFVAQTQAQNHKVSRIHIRKMSEKPFIFEMNYSNWRVDGSPEPDMIIGKKYIVSADISNCFPSIYTHSLPWALVGKEAAKNDRSKTQWFNQIDTCSQQVKHGETHGLLIGPHSSNILSEIILTVVDKNLTDKGWEFIRCIDDYTCYVESCEKAQQFLSELGAELRSFDLSLNHKKTKISLLPTAAVEQWVRKINAIEIRLTNGVVNYKSVRAYLDNVLELMQANREDGAILKYAIKVLSKQPLTQNAKELCIKTFMHLAIIYPYLVPLLEDNIFAQFPPEKAIVESFSKKVLEEALHTNNYEAAAFALYFAIRYDLILNFTAQQAIDSKDCIFMTIADLYFKDKGNTLEAKALKNYAKGLRDSDFEEYWIFAYEALTYGLLKGDWKRMKQQDISFIKPICKIAL